MSDSMEQSSAVETTMGCVKWFNNKAGYGFISVVGGEHAGTDVFVHHSAVKVAVEQYRYLVQGEYVMFTMCKADSSPHEYQAGEVRGLNGGKLMCETRHDTRNQNNGDQPGVRLRSQNRGQDEVRVARAPKYRGSGPREGEVWEVVRKRAPRNNDSRPRTDVQTAP